jgi:outer membrane autotransporter protein
VSLTWIDLDIDPFTSAGATIALAEGSGLRGTAGFRVGGDIAVGGGTLTPFFGAHAVEQLEGRNATDFTFGSTIVLAQDQLDTFGQTNFGLAFRSGMFDAFVRGELEFGGDVDGYGGRAGVRLRF